MFREKVPAAAAAAALGPEGKTRARKRRTVTKKRGGGIVTEREEEKIRCRPHRCEKRGLVHWPKSSVVVVVDCTEFAGAGARGGKNRTTIILYRIPHTRA